LDGKGSHLAERLKSAIEQSDTERDSRSEALQRRAEEGARARQALLEDLEQFAQAVGHVAVVRDDLGVSMRYRERALRFEPMGEGDRVRVTVEGWGNTTEHRVFRERDLADRWVLAYKKYGRDEKMPLFERGLEELMVGGLGLPRPEPEPERAMSPRTAQAIMGLDQGEAPLRAIRGGMADAAPRSEARAEPREEPKPDPTPPPADGAAPAPEDEPEPPDSGKRRRL
jgi:hypothetical protein